MKITGSDKYKIIIKSLTKFVVISPEGDGNVHGKAAENKRPKLYVISCNKKPIYVGITKQNIRNRLRMGFKAAGESGYHGYAWRKALKRKTVNIEIWYDKKNKGSEDIEAIEAELVFNIRKYLLQWPEYQTEIHFHQSTIEHKRVANKIFKEIVS